MKNNSMISFPRQLAILTLASAIALPVWAQDQAPVSSEPQSAPPVAAQQQPSVSAHNKYGTQKEGFWGRVNPFARKKWVKRQTDPLNDHLNELDEVNAQNGRDIKDVDSRAQAGISKAQSAADQANQAALAANARAQGASNTANMASDHVNGLNSTVNGLDQYNQVTDVTIKFRAGSPVLTTEAREQLDQIATTLNGRKGFILEMEAQSPAAGSVGIQSSQKLAESVKRYLVSEHQIPVYRMHSVALGNAQAPGTATEGQKPERVRTSTVRVRVMENSLASAKTAPVAQN